MRILNAVLTITLCIFLVACAHNLSSSEKSKIDSVTIGEPVLPEKLEFFGHKSQAAVITGALLLGPVGAVIAGMSANSAQSEPEQIKNYLAHEHVDIKAIIK